MILTNNPLAKEKYQVQMVEGDQREVLLAVRDLLHKGHQLITNPLAASGRMHFSPHRSVVVSDEVGAVSTDHILRLENSLSFLNRALAQHEVDYKNKEDYAVIDLELLNAALEEINR